MKSTGIDNMKTTGILGKRQSIEEDKAEEDEDENQSYKARVQE